MYKYWNFIVIVLSVILRLLFQTIDELPKLVENRKKKYLDNGLQSQPSAFICGSIDKIQSSFILINDIQYNFETPLKAVDCCFKSFFALNASYTTESAHVWTFLETYVYKITTKKQKIAKSIHALISDLDSEL